MDFEWWDRLLLTDRLYYPLWPVSPRIKKWSNILGIEIGSFDLSRYELNEADLDAAFTMIDDVAGSIAGTLVEVKTLALPFSGQINAAITNSFC